MMGVVYGIDPCGVCGSDGVMKTHSGCPDMGVKARGRAVACDRDGCGVHGPWAADSRSAADAWNAMWAGRAGDATRALLEGLAEHLEDHDGANTMEAWVVVDELEAALRECGLTREGGGR